MGKGPSGRKGNKKTRYSKIGNTSWLMAETVGLIDVNGNQQNKEDRDKVREKLTEIFVKADKALKGKNVEQRRDKKFIRNVKRRLGYSSITT